MRKTILVISTVVFVVVECFLIRLILRAGPDSKEFYTTPISELGRPINEIFFHQEQKPPTKARTKYKRHPAAQSSDQANLPTAYRDISSGQIYPQTITYSKVEKYLGEALPGHQDLYPIIGAIVLDPRTVTQAPGDFLGFFFGKVIFVNPNAIPRLIKNDEGMMVFVSAKTHTFYLAPGTVSAILKDFSEVDEIAAEYQMAIYRRLESLQTAVYSIPIGQDVGQLLQEMQRDPRFQSVALDLITDLKISLR